MNILQVELSKLNKRLFKAATRRFGDIKEVSFDFNSQGTISTVSVWMHDGTLNMFFCNRSHSVKETINSIQYNGVYV